MGSDTMGICCATNANPRTQDTPFTIEKEVSDPVMEEIPQRKARPSNKEPGSKIQSKPNEGAGKQQKAQDVKGAGNNGNAQSVKSSQNSVAPAENKTKNVIEKAPDAGSQAAEKQKAKAEVAAAVDKAISLTDKLTENFKHELEQDTKSWNAKLQKVHDSWPKNGDPVEVDVLGKNIKTWPLKFEDESDTKLVTVTTLLKSLGWDDSETGEIARLEYQLFPDICPDEDASWPVAWAHVQEAFRRSVVSLDDDYESGSDNGSEAEREWTKADDEKYPPLRMSCTLDASSPGSD